MKKQIMIIGLGQFGMSLAKTLCEKDFEVIAVDIDQELVNQASNFVTDAICINAIDENSLAKLSPKDRDIVVCSIRAKEPSILAVALLKQMGCENIIARATEPIHARILKAIGAKSVINPEHEFGKRFANKILYQDAFSEESSEDISFIEVDVKQSMIGKNLTELRLPDKFEIVVAGIIRNNHLRYIHPTERFEQGDKILLVGNDEATEKMLKEFR